MSSPFDSSSPISLTASEESVAESQNPTERTESGRTESARLDELRRYNILDTPSEAVFDRITKLAARLLDMPISLVSLVDRDRQWFKSCYGVDATQTGREVSFCSHAIEVDEVFVVPDATLDPRFADNPSVTGEQNLRFYAGAPLRTSQGLALGSLCVVDTRPRQFSAEQRATLTDLAAVVVDELELRLAAQAVEREAGERREAQQSLRQSESYLALALEEGKMGLFNVVLPQGTISWSPQMERLHSLEVGAFDGTLEMFETLVHPEDWPSIAEISRRVLGSGEEFHTEYRHLTPQGEVRWLEARGTASFENGVVARLTGITVDVTARKLAELKLRESQTRFQNAFRFSPIGMALTSPQGRCLQVNRKLCEFLGTGEEDLLQSEFVGRTHPDDLAANLELVRKALSGEISSYEIEKRYLHPDGSVVWALLSASLVRDEAGEPQYFISQIQDISARKQAESNLRASEARKAAILETALDCIITFDAQSRILEWNPAAETTFGYGREEALGARLHELIVPPELRGAHRAGIEKWQITGEGPILGQRIELPAVRADGKRITIEVAIVPIPDSQPPIFTGHLRDISERRASEERLRLLESVAVNANDAILITEAEPIDLPGPRILYANEAYLKMSGYTLEEIMGQTPRILQGDGTALEGRAAIRAALEKWRPIVIEIVNYKKDGTPFWVELSITPVANETGWFTHWVSVQRDVTERKQIEDALRESEARFGRIVANVPGMVYQFMAQTDGTFQFTYVSEGSREIFGLEPEEIMADAYLLTSRVHPDDAGSFSESVMRSAQTLEAWQWDGRFVSPEGEMKWVRGTSRPKREATGEVVWDGILFDITQSKQSVDTLQNAKNDAEAAREEAERANLAKSEFLSRMSHELRTPLNAILGFGQLLEMADLGEDDAQSADQIVRAGRHLLDLINEVLDIARIESGNLAISPEAVGAREIALETVSLVRPLAAARGIEILDERASNAAWHVLADRQRLKQILLNLLSNAVKYNREGGLVTFEIHPVGDKVRLCVRDTGMGMSPQLLRRLGTPFDRLGAETTGIEGTGVGLAVSQRLASAMGSRLEVESEVGVGSAFWLDLPRTNDPDAHFEAVISSDHQDVVSTQLVVLYIEDNPSNLQLVQRLLARRPEIRLLSAMHGDEGCELALLHCPDLILLDMHLPDISGLDVLARLKQNSRTAAIPVVVLSADATPRQVQRALDAGARSYMSKPLEVREFFACLDQTMTQKSAEKSDPAPGPATPKASA